MRPADGEASAPDFEKNLDKDPHEAKIPEFEGLNVKNEVCMKLFNDPVPDTCPEALQLSAVSSWTCQDRVWIPR